MSKFRGTGVALITPFDSEHNIDFNGLEKLVNHCLDNGVDYLVVMGTTGENATLNSAEKQEVLKFVQKVNNGRKPIVYGIGGNNTRALVETIKSTDLNGIDAILSVSPYYNKPTQEGIYQHFKTICEASPVPVILYNVPGRTSSNMSAATTLRLANDFDNVIAVKEASGDMEQVMKIINERPEGFYVISGDDNLTLPMIACGGDGVISVSGQGFPKAFTAMVNNALDGNFEKARVDHYRLFEVTKMLFAEGNPGGIKASLKHQNICEEHMRQPLWMISEGLRADIKKEMDRNSL
ncbi:dihydrodipicolinate synthase [Owenweeksia hongkongensis DSM 17368]|uniref:4-hydroxy-tetrahydrodipicolinate synthase n=1 Tax=Owenweeksia hongkongensis (strain DSM 17368 / CIP 108786 / JCM 12287 / NRRL B-23963 / UST20020801) TaxID=926562 RepID=G8R1M1_OWEHD|nr:4-hydroxy-tetrahydrodipicolinate synthase [Owenweeksia hongkongensis]AEV31760.1 dihydrodipicolinate synthase [Owenweeksia hongkongensis DSM 17368]